MSIFAMQRDEVTPQARSPLATQDCSTEKPGISSHIRQADIARSSSEHRTCHCSTVFRRTESSCAEVSIRGHCFADEAVTRITRVMDHAVPHSLGDKSSSLTSAAPLLKTTVMDPSTHQLADRMTTFPGDQSESDWLSGLEYLRSALNRTLAAHSLLGGYYIDDFPNHASAGGHIRIRAGSPVPGIDSDSWEGVLCWSGNRGSHAHSSALIFPFLDRSPMQPQGRLDDMGSGVEVDHFLLYRFEGGRFLDGGWHRGDGPGEWAHVSGPDDIYCRELEVNLLAKTFESYSPIYVDITIPELQNVLSNPDAMARISLIHVNRNREHTNLTPWTANLPRSATDTQNLFDASFPADTVMRIRLDTFRIRGGWKTGTYYLSLRVQNFHSPTNWSWSSSISRPIKLKIV